MSPRHLGLLAALASIWGGSYLLIKYALEDLSAPCIVLGRCVLASAVLFAALGHDGRRGVLADLRARPARALLLAGLAVAVPFTLITAGEDEVPSGLTAVLISPASIFVAMFAPVIDASERVDRRQAAGMVVGLGGVALVVGVESVSSAAELLGALGIVAAAACYGLSSFVVKGDYGHLRPMQTTWISVSVSALLVAPGALLTLPDGLPHARAALSLVALGTVGTALAFIIFYALIGEIGAGRASLVSYLAPGVALVYGAALLDEPVTLTAVAGLALILGGVALASRRRAVAVTVPAVSPPRS